MNENNSNQNLFYGTRLNTGRLSVTDIEHTFDREPSSVSIFSSNDVNHTNLRL